MPRFTRLMLLATCLALPVGGVVADEPPVDPLLELASDPTTMINLLVEARWRREKIAPTARCDDSTFVRRIHLDLVGRIPTPQERERFLQTRESNKREQLVTELLDSPEFARRMREVFDVALMGRAKSVAELDRRKNSFWWRFLEASFANDRGWNEVAETILLARPKDENDRGASWFIYARNNKHQDIAEAVSRSIFGIQIQCAQCHDHPLAVEIEQRHYWGLVAFFNRGKNTKSKRGPQIEESAVGGFAKFTDLVGDSNPAELVYFQRRGERAVEEVGITSETKDAPELYKKADDGLPKEPKFSRRRQFAEQIARDNRLVSRAMVNRVWALLMGRGLVHPVDEMDSEHPPSHPRLLEWLELDFHRSGGDVKRLVRAIVFSRPYQLTAKGDSDPQLFARGLEKPLLAEDLYRSVRVAMTGGVDGENRDLLFAFQQAFPTAFPVEVVANLKQSLMLSNDPRVVALTLPQEGNLTSRVAAVKSDAEQINLAYETILGRRPADDESKAIREHWSKTTKPADRKSQELVWALLTSPEFRFNH